MGYEEWLFDQNEEYYIQTGREFNDDQIDWMRDIYESYADNGFVDWSDHSDGSAWYFYMAGVHGMSDEDIARYA